jgi:hypothetical protein
MVGSFQKSERSELAGAAELCGLVKAEEVVTEREEFGVTGQEIGVSVELRLGERHWAKRRELFAHILAWASHRSRDASC